MLLVCRFVELAEVGLVQKNPADRKSVSMFIHIVTKSQRWNGGCTQRKPAPATASNQKKNKTVDSIGWSLNAEKKSLMFTGECAPIASVARSFDHKRLRTKATP